VVTFFDLDVHDLVDRLTKPKDAIIKQFQQLFETEGVELKFREDALAAIAQKSLEPKRGALGLRSIIEDPRLDVLFCLSSTKKTATIAKRMVEENELSFERIKPAIGV